MRPTVVFDLGEAAGSDETPARGFLTAAGLSDVVGSTGSLHPLRIRRAMAETTLYLLVGRATDTRTWH